MYTFKADSRSRDQITTERVENMLLGFNFYWLGKYAAFYIEGLAMTVQLALCALILGTVFGIFIGLMRVSHNKPLALVANCWVNFIRGVPVILQIYIIYYGLSLNISDFWAAVISLTVNSSAYIGETVRAGIQAVDKGQMEAARCIGMNYLKAMRLIIIPQAIKNILPAMGNEFIIIIKNTSLVSIIGLHELTYLSNTIRADIYLAFEPLIITALVYFALTYLLKQALGVMERRMHAND